MKKKNLLLTSFLIILLIALIHYFALDLKWYFTHRWVDIVIHMLGGFWIAVTSTWIYLDYTKEEVVGKKQTFLTIFFSVIFVGICWELFELFSGNTFVHTSNYWSDSISDTLNNFIGGTIAYYWIIR